MTKVDVLGTPHPISNGMAMVLETLRRRPQGIERHDLADLIGEEMQMKKCSVFGTVRRLREWLISAFELPPEWDPIPEEFQGEVPSKKGLNPRVLKILSLNLPTERLAPLEPAECFNEWTIQHDESGTKIRRSSQIYLNGALRTLAFSDALLLEILHKASVAVPFEEIERHFASYGFGPTTALASIRDARRFLRRALDLAETFDPIVVENSPVGRGNRGRGDVRLNLPTTPSEANELAAEVIPC